jgi:hypothetical protein
MMCVICTLTRAGVCTENLDSYVMVIESAEERMGANTSDPLYWARERHIFVQRIGAFCTHYMSYIQGSHRHADAELEVAGLLTATV